MSHFNRRRHRRAHLGQRCWCESGSITIYAVIHDISESGLFIRTSAPLYEGARTRVRWALPEGQEEIEAEAVVVWRRTSEQRAAAPPAGMGLQIESIDSEARERIREYVTSAPPSGE